MTRITFIGLCILLGGLYACDATKPKIIANDDNLIEAKRDTSVTLQDTTVKPTLPNVATEPAAPTVPIIRIVDTVFFQSVDLTNTVVGKRNPLGQRRGSMAVNIPVNLSPMSPGKKDSLIAFAYWIGIGEAPISEYESLEKEIPSGWSQPGVSAPLAAYLKGHPVVLPGLTDSEERIQQGHVRFDFVDLQGKAAFTKQDRYTPILLRESEHPNFGIIEKAQLQDLRGIISNGPDTRKKGLSFYFSYANQHQVNSYRMQLKVVAYYEVVEQ